MEPQNNLIEPTNKSHRILFTSLIVLLTAGVIGGSVYYVLGKQVKEQQKQIDELNKKAETKTETKAEEKKETPVVQKDETEGWSSFSGNGFSIKYPNNWEKMSSNANFFGLMDDKTIELKKTQPIQPSTLVVSVMSLTEASKNEGKTFTDWLQYFSQQSQTFGTKYTETSFAGVPAKTSVMSTDGTFYTINIVKNNLLYQLSMPTSQDTTINAWDKMDTILRKVLDTFRFTS